MPGPAARRAYSDSAVAGDDGLLAQEVGVQDLEAGRPRSGPLDNDAYQAHRLVRKAGQVEGLPPFLVHALQVLRWIGWRALGTTANLWVDYRDDPRQTRDRSRVR